MRTKKQLFVAALIAVATVATSFAQNLSSYVLHEPACGSDCEGNLDPAQLTDGVLTLSGTNLVLDQKVYVMDGQTIAFEPGSVVKATFGQGLNAPAIIVTRGGKIMANGTKNQPIIFTTDEDPLNGTYSYINKEKWGGIIILGKAQNNIVYCDGNPEADDPLGVASGVGFIEGLDYPDDRHHYGAMSWSNPGADDCDRIPVFENDDNSGVLRHVIIKHGGSEIGTANEINGLTCGSVGSGTVLEYIEIVSNGDDGIEFFGGTVNIKYASIIACEDDYIDVDQGYIGKGQFIYGVMLPSTTGDSSAKMGDNGFEWDGNDFNGRSYLSGQCADWALATGPYGQIISAPTFSNVTIIGRDDNLGFELKEDIKGSVCNAIIAYFDQEGRHKNSSSDKYTCDSTIFETRNDTDSTLLTDILFIESNITGDDGGNLDANLLVNSDRVASGVITYPLGVNTILAGGIYVQTITAAVNPVPALGDPNIALAGSCKPWETDAFFSYAPYRGAFEPGSPAWTRGWSTHDAAKSDLAAYSCAEDITGNGFVDGNDQDRLNGMFNKNCGE